MSGVSVFRCFGVSDGLADGVTCEDDKKITRTHTDSHGRTRTGMSFGVSGFRGFGVSDELVAGVVEVFE